MEQALKVTRKAHGIIIGIFLLIVFSLLVMKHYEIAFADVYHTALDLQTAMIVAASRTGLVHPCGSDRTMVAFSFTAYVCTNSNNVVYSDIYHSYPASREGREAVYSFLNQGDRAVAEEMLQGTLDLARYDPVELPDPITWEEDPFKERYWRFLFYSLRPTRHLLAAAVETRDKRYYDALKEMVGGFIDTGIDKQFAWDDNHGVAFRTMVLVNTWWKLREAGELSPELSDKILSSLEEHGAFLLDPDNYEGEHNHGITQAAALLVLGENFPDLEQAPVWKATGIRRLEQGLRDVVDEDGVLVENSPYYHFYSLEKYWEIYRYVQEYDIEVSADFLDTINAMVAHATYVLQPDVRVPLLGASIPRHILLSGEYRAMAEENPHLAYVLTEGEDGTKPPQLHIRYPSSGIILLRSGWGERRQYENETQVVFDTGPYRTDHSDLDALGIALYSEGVYILRESGLYTYETDHALYNYFHGTRGHNTIMVDERNQAAGSGTSIPIETGAGYAVASAMHELYDGVTHSRSIAQIENGALLIVDDIRGAAPHTYEQLFHLSENASLNTEDRHQVGGFVQNGNERIPLLITQFGTIDDFAVWKNEPDIPRGLCANGYEVLIPCHELSFEINGNRAQYLTLVQFGQTGTSYNVQKVDADTMRIQTPVRTYTINISFPENAPLDSPFVLLAVNSSDEQSYLARLWRNLKDRFQRMF